MSNKKVTIYFNGQQGFALEEVLGAVIKYKPVFFALYEADIEVMSKQVLFNNSVTVNLTMANLLTTVIDYVQIEWYLGRTMRNILSEIYNYIEEEIKVLYEN